MQQHETVCASAGASEDEDEEDGELAEYISGQAEVPLPVYFIGGFGRGALHAIAALEEAASSVRYLGRAGLTSLHGLSVAYLDGLHDSQAYQEHTPHGSAAAASRFFTKAREPAALPLWRA